MLIIVGFIIQILGILIMLVGLLMIMSPKFKSWWVSIISKEKRILVFEGSHQYYTNEKILLNGKRVAELPYGVINLEDNKYNWKYLN